MWIFSQIWPDNEPKWVMDQNRFNDNNIANGRSRYPIMQIAPKKKVSVEYNHLSGNTYIVFEKTGTNCVLRLDSFEWAELKIHSWFILKFIFAVERDHDVLEILKNQKIDMFNGQVVCRIPVNNEIMISLKWSEKNAMIDIRRGEMREGENGQYWKGNDSGICFSACSFKYFYKHLLPKLTNGVRRWAEMHNAGYHLQCSLFSTYKPEGNKNLIDSWPRFLPVEDEKELPMPATVVDIHYCGN